MRLRRNGEREMFSGRAVLNRESPLSDSHIYWTTTSLGEVVAVVLGCEDVHRDECVVGDEACFQNRRRVKRERAG